MGIHRRAAAHPEPPTAQRCLRRSVTRKSSGGRPRRLSSQGSHLPGRRRRVLGRVEGIRPVAPSRSSPRNSQRRLSLRDYPRDGPARRRSGISADVQSAAARGTAVGNWFACRGHRPGPTWIEPPPARARPTTAAEPGSGSATAFHAIGIRDRAVKPCSAQPDGRAGICPPCGS